MRNYGVDYPGFVNPPDAAYPYSSPKNATTDTAEDGTPVEEKWVGDVWGFFQSAVSEAGITPNGQTESVSNPQILSSVKKATLSGQLIRNRFVGDQNFNVQGRSSSSTPPDSTPKSYSTGEEMTASRTVGAPAISNATFDGEIFDAASGVYFQEYDGDFTGDYFALVQSDGTHSTSGVSMSLESGRTRISVDMSIAPPHKFLGFSSKQGEYEEVSDNESEVEFRGGFVLISNANGLCQVFGDGYKRMSFKGGADTQQSLTLPFPFDDRLNAKIHITHIPTLIGTPVSEAYLFTGNILSSTTWAILAWRANGSGQAHPATPTVSMTAEGY